MAGFHEIIGHDDVVNHLQNAIQMGNVWNVTPVREH